MEEEKSGISLGEIFRVIFSQKWLALILAVVITVVGTLALYYGYGASKTEYASTFSVNVPTNSEGLLVYPNGRTVNYRDWVSKDNLNSIKAGNEKYKDIDVSGLSIAQNVSENDGAGVTYTIKANSRCFPSGEVAVDFMAEVAGTISRSTLAWAQSLSAETQKGYEDCIGNERRLEYFGDRLDQIEKYFTNLGGMSSHAALEVKNMRTAVETYTGVLHTYYYESNVETLNGYVYRIKELNREKEPVEQALKNLMDVISGAAQSGSGAGEGNTAGAIINGSEITSYSERLAIINQQINDCEQFLKGYEDAASVTGYTIPETVTASKECAKFEESLSELLNNAKKLTDEHVCGYYKETTLVSYEGAQLYTSGGISALTSFLISFIAGLVISAIATYVVAKNKAAKKAAAAEAAVSETETEETAEEEITE